MHQIELGGPLAFGLNVHVGVEGVYLCWLTAPTPTQRQKRVLVVREVETPLEPRIREWTESWTVNKSQPAG